MPSSVIIASARKNVSRALAEQLKDAHFSCTEVAAPVDNYGLSSVVLWDTESFSAERAPKDAALLYLTSAPIANLPHSISLPVRLSELLEQLTLIQNTRSQQLAVTDEWSLNIAERALKHCAGKPSVALTEKECTLLERLLTSNERSATRAELLEKVWGYGDDITTHTLETHIYRLRSKLSDALGAEWIIATDGGYRITA